MGYDLTRFLGEIDDEFYCSICTMVLEDPVQTPCDHLFCNECIKGWLSINSMCPVDRANVTITCLKPASRTIRNLMNKLDVKCEFQPKGCETVIKLEYLQDHLNICQYNANAQVICDKGCNITMSRREYQENCTSHWTNRLKIKEEEILVLTHEISSQKKHFERIINHQQETMLKLNDEMNKLRTQQEFFKSLLGGESSTTQKFNLIELPNYDPMWQGSHNMKISINQPDIMEFGDNGKIAFVQSIYPFKSGNSSFKVQILKSGYLVLGLTPKGHPSATWPGYNKSSIGYHAYDGRLWINSNCEHRGTQCKMNDIIEFGIKFPLNFVNNSNCVVEFYVSINGRLKAEKSIRMPKHDIFPTISLLQKGEKVQYLRE